MRIRVADSLIEHSKGKLVLGVVKAKVKVEKKNEEIWGKLEAKFKEVEVQYKTAKVPEITPIKAVIDTYKSLGLKVSDYKGSNEALLKRAIGGKGIYQINNVVEANNLVSIVSLRSVGSYDLSKLSGDVEFRAGREDETYPSTSKKALKLAKLPVLCDATGPFGSPTSDSERALITETTTELMTVIFSFDGEENLQAQMEQMGELLRTYAAGQDISYHIVRDQPVELKKSDGELKSPGKHSLLAAPMNVSASAAADETPEVKTVTEVGATLK